jgi:hypothetical protein
MISQRMVRLCQNLIFMLSLTKLFSIVLISLLVQNVDYVVIIAVLDLILHFEWTDLTSASFAQTIYDGAWF